ncbi:MAG: four helix bundle protein [Bacteroidia bacterium]
MREFRKLKVWNSSVELTVKIYSLVSSFPSSDNYTIGSQMKRSSLSIASNIAEGSSRRSEVEKRRFVEIAQGSAYELETQLEVARRCQIIADDTAAEILAEMSLLQVSLYHFEQVLSGTRTSRRNRMISIVVVLMLGLSIALK